MAMTADQYKRQLVQLLPPGPALQVVDGSELDAVLGWMATFLAEVDVRADIVRTEANPQRAVQLLAEWEGSLGLPDSCTVGAQTIAERQIAVTQKLTDRRGARISRYVQLAAMLGYPGATTKRFSYHNCEMSCETPVNEISSRFVWMLNVPAGTRVVESTVESGTDDPLVVWGDSVLECVIHRETPAISSALIAYGGS